MTEFNRCAICDLRIRRVEERDRPWIHDDPAYDPFGQWPVHAPTPGDFMSAHKESDS